MSLFAKDIGIDLGTANTLIHVKGRGIVLREPSVVAINIRTNEVIAVGEEAKSMLGRTPEGVNAIRPLKDGVIADLAVTQAMLKYFIKKACQNYLFGKPTVIVCVPSGVTEVEERAVELASIQAGAKEAILMEEPMAAAIGADLAVEEPYGSMIVDIGGGTTEVAVISLGGIVTAKSLRIAGDELDDSIVNYIKKEHNLMIGERTAEDLKINIGCAYPNFIDGKMEIRGRDLVTGLPKNLVVTSAEILEAIKEPINAMVDTIKLALEKTPPELAADIMEKGITLAGGGALIRGLDKLISEETGMPVNIAKDPLDCVALGAGKALEHVDKIRVTKRK